MKLKALGIAAVFAVATAGLVSATTPAKAELCTLNWAPVCANDHGIVHTYSNACWANLWGAKVLYNGECGSKPMKVHHKKHHKKVHHKATKKKVHHKAMKAKAVKKAPMKKAPMKKATKKPMKKK